MDELLHQIGELRRRLEELDIQEVTPEHLQELVALRQCVDEFVERAQKWLDAAQRLRDIASKYEPVIAWYEFGDLVDQALQATRSSVPSTELLRQVGEAEKLLEEAATWHRKPDSAERATRLVELKEPIAQSLQSVLRLAQEERKAPSEEAKEPSPAEEEAEKSQQTGAGEPVEAAEREPEDVEAAGSHEATTEGATAEAAAEIKELEQPEAEVSEETRAAVAVQEGAAAVGPEGVVEAPRVLSALEVCVKEGQWGRAYWIARLCHFLDEAEVRIEAPPPWVVEAVALARYCRPAGVDPAWRGQAIQRFQQIVGEHPAPWDDPLFRHRPMMAYAEAAAALPQGFCGNVSSAVQWLDDALRHEKAWAETETLRDLLEHTRNSLAELPEEVWTQVQKGPAPTALSDIAAQAREWKARTLQSRPTYLPASKALHYLLSHDPTVCLILDTVISASTDVDENIRRSIADLHDPRHRRRLIEKAHRQLRQGRPKPITGHALKWADRRLAELYDIAEAWERTAREISRGPSPEAIERARQLVDLWVSQWTKAAKELRRRESLTGLDRAFADCLILSLATVASEVMGRKANRWPHPQRSWEDEKEAAILVVPWLWRKMDEWQIKHEEAQEGLERLLAPEPGIEQLFSRLVEDGCFDIATRMLEVLERSREVDPAQLDKLRVELDQDLAAMTGELQRGAAELGERLQDLRMRGGIDESTWQQWSDRLANITREVQEAAESELRLDEVRAQLGEIERFIREAEASRRREVEQRLQQLSEQLEDKRARTHIEQARQYLEKGQFGFALMELDRAEQAARGEKTEVPVQAAQVHRNFLSRHHELLQWLDSIRSLRQVVMQPGPLQLSPLPKPRQDEFINVLARFRELRRVATQRGHREAPTHQALRQIFGDYLGFEIQSIDRLGETEHTMTFSLSTTPVESRERIPVPEFGSLAEGRYKVIVVWGRRPLDVIASAVQAEAEGPIFVLYVGRLTRKDLEIWSSVAAALSNPRCLLVDESLLANLADLRADRLQALFYCALPYTVINPYHATGAVPPEMFFGRDQDIRSLMDPRGSCIVYGGRQLGKSALLREVQRRFHNPDEARFGIYVDIRLPASPMGADPTTVWFRIRGALVHAGLVDNRTPPDREKMCEALRAICSRDADVRLLLLLDEADRFLAADAQLDFENVSEFRRLMDDTERRIKVVFAGLQSVQRYYRVPNHPFAQIGQPIQVGPLADRDASMLIKMPLEALGCDLTEEAVLRIRAYTYDHPGLIQYFCSAILNRIHSLRRDRGTRQPRYRVDLGFVDDIFRDPETQRAIRDRFEWTLNLDDRYRAMVYTLIWLWQNGALDSVSGVSAAELLEWARDWWPQGFENVDTAEADAMLTELVGLGILRPVTEGNFALREWRLSTLAGTPEQVTRRLEEIRRSSPARQPRPEDHHPVLSTDDLPSPLTLQDLAILSGRTSAESVGPARSGVILIAGSNAAGALDVLPAASELLAPEQDRQSVIVRPLPPVGGRSEVANILQNAKRWKRQIALIWAQPEIVAEWPQSMLVDVVRMAQEVLSAHRGQPTVRLVIQLSPGALWRWLTGVREEDSRTEPRLISVKPWTAEAIYQWLSVGMGVMLTSSDDAQRIVDATGGWHLLVKKFWSFMRERYGEDIEHQRPWDALADLERWLQSGEGLSELRGAFELVQWPDEARMVWHAVSSVGGLKEAEEEIEGLADILHDQFKRRMSNATIAHALRFLQLLGVLRRRNTEEGTEWSVEAVAARAIEQARE